MKKNLDLKNEGRNCLVDYRLRKAPFCSENTIVAKVRHRLPKGAINYY